MALEDILMFFPKLPFSIGQIVGIIIASLIVIVGFIFFIKVQPFKKFPVKVKINKIRKDGKKLIRFTKARRIVTTDGEQEYELKSGEKIPAQSFINIDVMVSGKEFIELDELENNRFVPHNPEKNIKKQILEMTYDDVNYTIWKLRKNIERFKRKGFWERYGTTIIVVMSLIVSGFLIYIVMQYGILPTIAQGNVIGASLLEFQEKEVEREEKWMTFMEKWMERFERPVPAT